MYRNEKILKSYIMKIITCAGFYNTGSSAVTDFFSEFDNVHSLGETEFKFLQDCDGITALEMNLIDHPHRHNSGHAIKRFLKAARFENGNFLSKRYRRFFGDKYMQYTIEYVNEITDLQSHCFWRGDCIERGELFYIIDALFTLISSKIRRRWATSILSLTNELNYFTSIDRDHFYAATKRYTSKLLNCFDDGSEFLMIDQLTPPTDINRYFNYVDDMYVVVVDRDPRDVFLMSKNYPHYYKFPHGVEEFCKWYRIIRKNNDVPNHRILKVQFEDLIYNYDKTTVKLMDLVGMDESHHVRPLEFFNPQISIKGTKLWENNFSDEIAYIEKNLPDFLYKYE